MKPIASILTLFLAMASASVWAELDFGRASDYPAVGLAFPILSRGYGDPLPMPKAHTFLPVNTSDTLTREDRFAPYELWYNSQCCGRWRDDSGRVMTLGRMTSKFPQFAEETVSRERYSLEVARTSLAPDPKDSNGLDRWVATFVGITVYPPEKLDLNSFALDKVLAYPTQRDDLLVYAFLPRRSGSGSHQNWYCVTVKLATGDSRDNAVVRMEKDFIGQLKLIGNTAKTSASKAEELDLTDSKKRPSAKVSPNPIRDEVRKSVENYSNWWVAETENFMVISDVYSEIGKSLVRQLLKELPPLYKACRKILPPLAELDNELWLVRLFQRQDDYVRYLGKDMEWSGGAWTPSRRELVLFMKGGFEELMPTIRHEAFHQYLSYAYAMLPTAPWLNEGHACFFEPAWLGSKGQMLFEEDEYRERILTSNLDTATALLPLMLEMSYSEFYDGTASEKQLKYAMAWGLAYYLQKGLPVSGDSKAFRQILPKYAAALKKTRDDEKATKLAFEDIEMERFQEAFKNFWSSDRSNALKHDIN